MGANEGPIVAIDERPCRICVHDQVIDLKWTEYDLMGYQGWYLPTETTNPTKKDKKKEKGKKGKKSKKDQSSDEDDDDEDNMDWDQAQARGTNSRPIPLDVPGSFLVL